MNRPVIFVVVFLGNALLSPWVMAQVQQVPVEVVEPADLSQDNFSWDDVEELPVGSQEELGVEVDGEAYVPEYVQEKIEQQKALEQAKEEAAAADAAAETGEFEDVPTIPADETADEMIGAAQPNKVSSKKLGGGAGPDEYTVSSGDTLWDICERFFGDPYLWPKLWSMNSYITNPHLIFPGHLLRFYMGSSTSAPALAISDGQIEDVDLANAQIDPNIDLAEAKGKNSEKPQVDLIEAKGNRIEGNDTGAKHAVVVHNFAFLMEKGIKPVGYISHSGEEKKMLSMGDRVYMRFNDMKSVKVGDKFHVMETQSEVSHPKKSFKGVGYIVHAKGRVRVTAVDDNVVTGTVEDAWEASSKNDPLLPYQPLVRRVMPKRSSKALDGTIVASSMGNTMISQRDVAFIDIGSKDGVEFGDMLHVVRRGDGFGIYASEKELPFVEVARMTVIDVDNKTAAVFVNWSRKSVEIGDRVLSRF